MMVLYEIIDLYDGKRLEWLGHVCVIEGGEDRWTNPLITSTGDRNEPEETTPRTRRKDSPVV